MVYCEELPCTAHSSLRARIMASGAGSASTTSLSEEKLMLAVKWSGKEYTVRVCGDDSVGELKRRICQLTNVLPKRQRLLYPKLLASRLADDSVLLCNLPLKSSLKMTMIGFLLQTFLLGIFNCFLKIFKFCINIKRIELNFAVL